MLQMQNVESKYVWGLFEFRQTVVVSRVGESTDGVLD
jgi:hypothetical protein